FQKITILPELGEESHGVPFARRAGERAAMEFTIAGFMRRVLTARGLVANTLSQNREGIPMRLVNLIAAVAVLFSSPASAQNLDTYSNRENFFSINLPEDPAISTVPYKTLKGTNLEAHMFTAKAPADSILAGTYAITVVDYSNAKDELSMAVEQ